MPEYVGKLNFYLSAVNAQLKHPQDQPSIGILLCKTPKGSLPSIEALEQELGESMDG